MQTAVFRRSVDYRTGYYDGWFAKIVVTRDLSQDYRDGYRDGNADYITDNSGE